jgi:Transcriptional regulator, AbiEi antitoxin, Type IV TA system
MKPPSEKQAAAEIADVLADVLGCGPKAIRLRPAADSKGYDYLISAPGHRFVVGYKRVASAGPLTEAMHRLKLSADNLQDRGQLLIVVPFMGEVGKEICDRAGVSWMDLSGNAKIVAAGLRIHIEGRPNKYSERGRPPNVFASKSSRVARQLLLYPQNFQAQAEIARQTGLDDGYVSKIVRKLEEERYVTFNDDGALRPHDPHLLLDAWQAAYDFHRHRVLKGHVPARSGDELLQRITRILSHEKIDHAATGLAAAWLYTNFAAFRLATVYLLAMPARSLLKEIEFSDEPKGANLWLVEPDDEGVFQGSQKQDGVRCVSPLQTYLDLKGQPERAKDAAVELRKKLLAWGPYGK